MLTCKLCVSSSFSRMSLENGQIKPQCAHVSDPPIMVKSLWMTTIQCLGLLLWAWAYSIPVISTVLKPTVLRVCSEICCEQLFCKYLANEYVNCWWISEKMVHLFHNFLRCYVYIYTVLRLTGLMFAYDILYTGFAYSLERNFPLIQQCQKFVWIFLLRFSCQIFQM